MQGRKLKQPLEWLKPTKELKRITLRGFAKNIRKYLLATLKKEGAVALTHRRRTIAVAVDRKCYEEALELKTICKKLIEHLDTIERQKAKEPSTQETP